MYIYTIYTYIDIQYIYIYILCLGKMVFEGIKPQVMDATLPSKGTAHRANRTFEKAWPNIWCIKHLHATHIWCISHLISFDVWVDLQVDRGSINHFCFSRLWQVNLSVRTRKPWMSRTSLSQGLVPQYPQPRGGEISQTSRRLPNG